jgi:serine protease AprX
MRCRRSAVLLLVGVIGLAFGAGSARAGNVHGPKVDDRVALAADQAGSPSTLIPVIVFGKGITFRKNPQLVIKGQLTSDATAGSVTPADLDRLAGDPNVAFVAPDTAVAPLGRPAPAPAPLVFPALETLYPVVDDAPDAWARGYTGAGVGVAVIDSGTVAEDFDTRLAAKTGANNGNDVYGHGMLVSHIVAGCCAGGSFVGIAPGANVVSYNVDSGFGASTSDVITALLWVIANQAKYNIKVVNLSLGETTPSVSTQSLLDSVVESLQSYGILVVTSAGNAGPDSVVYAPGNDPFALTVGATDTNGTADSSDDTLTAWSSYGATLDGYAKPDVVAPGRRIMSYLERDSVLGTQAPADDWSTKHDYAGASGTSFSAPQVAGAAAIVFQAHPTWTPGQVKWVLEHTARAVAGSAAGELDVNAAVNYQGTPPDANAGLAASTFGFDAWVNDQLNGNHSGWKQATWNQATWNGNSWKPDDWHQATWNSNAWSQATWNQSTWNQATWNGYAWGH